LAGVGEAREARGGGGDGVSEERLCIKAVGDICLDGVAGDPFVHVAAELDADVLFGNLECCFAERGTPADKVVFNADPASARFLVDHGFDVLCLANNHVMDFGVEGLEDTLAVLERHGLVYNGAGRNAKEASSPTWLQAKGLRVAVLSTADATGGDADRPGVSVVNTKAMAAAIRAVRASADVVVASYHGGIELDTAPSPSIVRSLRSLVDAGADVVLGHHPHVLQAAEVYRGRVIAYSLGNFVFDNRRYGPRAALAATTAILAVDVDLDPATRRVASASYRYIPAEIGPDFSPRKIDGEGVERFTAHVADLEAQLSRVDDGAVDVQRLRNMTGAIHHKSLGTLVRYGVRHARDYTFKELVMGAGLVLRGMLRRRPRDGGGE